MVHSNMIVIRTVIYKDVKISELIFGTNVTSLKGELVRHNPASVVAKYVEIPREAIDPPK